MNIIDLLSAQVDKGLEQLTKLDITTKKYSDTLTNIFGTSNLVGSLRQQEAHMQAQQQEEDTDKEEEVKEDATN